MSRGAEGTVALKSLEEAKEDSLCVVCYEDVSPNDGIWCNSEEEEHAICKQCSSQWLATMSTEAGSVRHSCGMNWVRCVGAGCESRLDFTEKVKPSVPNDVWRKFENTVERVWNTRREELVECLNLRCPKCSILLDPEAEACAAMTCSYCGCFFCYACLKRVRSQQEAHAHVPLAHGCDSAYLPRDKLVASHNEIRQSAVLDALRLCGDKDIALDLLDSIDKELSDLGMQSRDIREIFLAKSHQPKKQEAIQGQQHTTTNETKEVSPAPIPITITKIDDDDMLRAENISAVLTLDDESDLLATAGKRVLAAACRGNWTAFRQLATEYGDNGPALFEDRDELGRPALQHVIFNSPEPTRDMALAVRLGCRVDQPQEHGWRPLHLAVWKRDVELVKALVDDFGADLDAKIPGDGKTALMLATAADDLDTMRCLLDRGADPAAVDDNGRTALAHAFDDDDDDEDHDLIANANNQNAFPGPEQEEEEADDRAFNEHLFDDDDDDDNEEEDDDEDDIASEDDPLEALEINYQEGRRITKNSTEEQHNRPLSRQERRLAVTVRKVEVYLQYATPRLWTVRDKLQDTALHQVIKCCHVDSQAKILEMLVDGGAPVDAVGELDWRPLHLAAWFRAHAAVSLLLSRGASVDGRCGPRAGVLNNTPLHLCAGGSATSFKDFLNHSAPHDVGNLFQTLVALLSHGADPRATNQRGQTPLQYARDEVVLAGLDRRDRHMLKASHAAVDRVLSAPDPLRAAQRALDRHYRNQGESPHSAPGTARRRQTLWLAQHHHQHQLGGQRAHIDYTQVRGGRRRELLQGGEDDEEDDFFLGDNARDEDDIEASEEDGENELVSTDPTQPEPTEKEEPSDGPRRARVEPPASESFVSGFFSPRSVLDLAQALARRFDSSHDLRQQEKEYMVEEPSKFRGTTDRAAADKKNQYHAATLADTERSHFDNSVKRFPPGIHNSLNYNNNQPPFAVAAAAVLIAFVGGIFIGKFC